MLLSHGVWKEWHLFNQRLLLTVPQLDTSCRSYSQVVSQRYTSLIEIQETVFKSSSQGRAAEKNMRWNQADWVRVLHCLNVSTVLKLFEEPLSLSAQINLKWSLSNDCYGLPVLVIKTVACSHQPTPHRYAGESLFDPHQLWLALLSDGEMSHFTYPNISLPTKGVVFLELKETSNKVDAKRMSPSHRLLLLMLAHSETGHGCNLGFQLLLT